MSNPLAGARYLLRGFQLIWKPGIRVYVIIPLLINSLIFAALIALGFDQFGSLVDRFLPQLPDWLQWLAWLMWLLFAISLLLILFFTFSLVMNLIGSPFNSLLADAVVLHLTGQRPNNQGHWSDFFRGFFPAIAGEARKLLYAVSWALPFLLLFLLPVVNLIAPLLWLGYGAWMLAIEYGDYPMGNRGLEYIEQRRLIREKRLLWLGFGGATMAGTLIPLVNFLVMPAATAGAATLWVENYADRLEQAPVAPASNAP